MAISVIHQPAEMSFSRNYIYVSFQSTGHESLDNYSVEVEVLIDENGPLENVVTLRDIPNGAGITTFPIHEILHSELDNRLNVNIPSPTNTSDYILDNQRRYSVRFYERFGNPSEAQGASLLVPRKVIFGSVDEADAPTWFDDVDETNSLWTGQPDKRRVKKDLPQYLHWYNYTDANVTPSLAIEAFDSTGTSVTATEQQNQTVEPGQTLIIPVGYNQLSIDDILSDASKYTVQVEVQGSTAENVAPLRTWYVDCFSRECKERMLWLNTFNAPETIELTGNTRKSINIARTISERIATTNYSAIIPDRFQWRQVTRDNYTFRTGYHSQEQIIALEEMLIINRVYRLSGNGYAPLLLTDSRYKITECFEFLHTLEFNADIAKRTRAYTVFPDIEDEECCCDDALVFGNQGAITFNDGTAIAFGGELLIG